MASKTKHLPIYKTCYELVCLVTMMTKQFSRDYRPTLGRIMQKEAVDLVLYVYRANAAIDKLAMIGVVLEKIEVVFCAVRHVGGWRMLAR